MGRHPGWNHRERRRLLYPRDYCVVPAEFGYKRHARFYVPEGGREEDAWLAHQQHLIVIAWNERDRIPPTADLHRHFGLSRQVMHLRATGRQWMSLYEACALDVFELDGRRQDRLPLHPERDRRP